MNSSINCGIYIVKYYSAIKRNELLIYSTLWMKFKVIMCWERMQYVFCMIQFTWFLGKCKKLYKIENRSVVAWERKEGERGMKGRTRRGGRLGLQWGTRKLWGDGHALYFWIVAVYLSNLTKFYTFNICGLLYFDNIPYNYPLIIMPQYLIA